VEPEQQALVFSVAGPASGAIADITFEWERAGSVHELRLTDDGSYPSDVPWDGVWTTEDAGIAVHEVSGRLHVTDLEGRKAVIDTGAVAVYDMRHDVVSWQLSGAEGQYAARLVVAAWPGESVLLPEGASIYVGAAWTGLCFAIAAALIHVVRREGVGW